MTRVDLLARAERLRSGRTPFVFATVVRTEKPASARAGDCALVLADGTMDGFVGGTCAENTVRTMGLRLLESGESTLLRITPDADEKPTRGADGLVLVNNPCLSGGSLEIFLEPNIPATLIHVFGDQPAARALGTVGEALGYEVLVTSDPNLDIDPDTAALIVSSHGRSEAAMLTKGLKAGVPYVALVASPKRGRIVVSGLDIDEAERERVVSPAGLDIGARTPAEIAMSVYAEMLAARPRSTGGLAALGVTTIVEVKATADDAESVQDVVAVKASGSSCCAGEAPAAQESAVEDPTGAVTTAEAAEDEPTELVSVGADRTELPVVQSSCCSGK
jgi:xanthine dehydrogenase accessory factor